ncbi:MAG: sirohydrochlorin cobaltochelatase, partial [Eubacterium sp.]|nr:sirohydrochlorin cobaltochelatase [Eubacterium sp.]
MRKPFYRTAAVAMTLMMSVSMMTGCGAKEAPATEATTVADDAKEEDDEENYNTGDASLDDIRNADNIGDSELLVVSFGTSFNDSRRFTIGAIEGAIDDALGKDYSVRRAFTSQIIIDHVQKRDGVLIDNMETALKRAADNNVKTLVIQPTQLMDGFEYQEIDQALANYSDAFESVSIGAPLLTSDEDYDRVAEAMRDVTKEYDDGETAIVFMGHGTEADSNGVYARMQSVFDNKGYSNYFIGTVEATPSLDDVVAKVKAGNYKKVVLRPMMVVAGD